MKEIHQREKTAWIVVYIVVYGIILYTVSTYIIGHL